MGGSPTALVSDVHEAEVAYTPYQRPPDWQALRTAIPRGLRSFVVRGATLAAKPVNDTMLLSIALTLPGGFGYVLNELSCNIVVDTADDWDGVGHWRVSQASRALDGFDYRYPITFTNFSQNGVAKGVRGTRYDNLPIRTPILPGSTGSTQSLSFVNLAAAVGAAGTVDAMLSFWEYDLEQLQYYFVHMASGVYSR